MAVGSKCHTDRVGMGGVGRKAEKCITLQKTIGVLPLKPYNLKVVGIMLKIKIPATSHEIPELRHRPNQLLLPKK